MNYPLKFIQVLRGFAAIAVLLYHTGIYASIYFGNSSFSFEYGTLGVDFFFTLSGFIITYIHLKVVKERGSVINFAGRRFIRVFPFYWLILLAVIALDPSTFPGRKLFIENLLLFRLPMSDMPLKVAWSLTFEIMFYFIFAVAIAAGWKAAKFMLAAWLVLIIFSPTIQNTFYNVLVSNLNIEFLFGCFAAYVFIEKKPPLKASVFLAGLIFLAVSFIVCIAWRGFDRFNIIFITLMGATSGWIVLHAALLDKSQRYRSFALPVLVLAGDASYAIYLTHTAYMPYLFRAFNQLTHAFHFTHLLQSLMILLIIFLSIAIGILIHIFIEKPMLVFLRRKFHLFKTGTSRS